MALRMGIFQAETKKAAEDAAAKEEGKCLAAEAAGEGKESDERVSAANLESSLDAESYESTEDWAGSF